MGCTNGAERGGKGGKEGKGRKGGKGGGRKGGKEGSEGRERREGGTGPIFGSLEQPKSLHLHGNKIGGWGGGGGGSCSFYYSIFMMHLNTRSKDCTEHTQINFSPKALASVFIQRQKLLLLIRPYSYSSANTRGAVCLMTMKATQVHGITPRQIS